MVGDSGDSSDGHAHGHAHGNGHEHGYGHVDSSNGPFCADMEVALHLLPSDECLQIDSLLVGCVTLDATASPVSTRTIAVQASWAVPSLMDALAGSVGSECPD